jgi:Ran GTPase-activating protein (RanGAP) involved in mRNA processing and transport
MSDSVAQQLRLSTTVTPLVLCYGVLSHENVQQLKAVLLQNMVLESLDLESGRLGSASFAEIAPLLHSNTSIKSLVLPYNGLHEVESSANVLRDLIHRNKTITSLCIGGNAFGRNAAAVESIAFPRECSKCR